MHQERALIEEMLKTLSFYREQKIQHKRLIELQN